MLNILFGIWLVGWPIATPVMAYWLVKGEKELTSRPWVLATALVSAGLGALWPVILLGLLGIAVVTRGDADKATRP